MRAFVSGLPVKASDFARGFDTNASAEREEFEARTRASIAPAEPALTIVDARRAGQAGGRAVAADAHQRRAREEAHACIHQRAGQQVLALRC